MVKEVNSTDVPLDKLEAVINELEQAVENCAPNPAFFEIRVVMVIDEIYQQLGRISKAFRDPKVQNTETRMAIILRNIEKIPKEKDENERRVNIALRAGMLMDAGAVDTIEKDLQKLGTKPDLHPRGEDINLIREAISSSTNRMVSSKKAQEMEKKLVSETPAALLRTIEQYMEHLRAGEYFFWSGNPMADVKKLLEEFIKAIAIKESSDGASEEIKQMKHDARQIAMKLKTMYPAVMLASAERELRRMEVDQQNGETEKHKFRKNLDVAASTISLSTKINGTEKDIKKSTELTEKVSALARKYLEDSIAKFLESDTESTYTFKLHVEDYKHRIEFARKHITDATFIQEQTAIFSEAVKEGWKQAINHEINEREAKSDLFCTDPDINLHREHIEKAIQTAENDGLPRKDAEQLRSKMIRVFSEMIKKGIEKLTDEFASKDEFDLMEMMLSRIFTMLQTGEKTGINEKDLNKLKENLRLLGTKKFIGYIRCIYENIEDVMPLDTTTQLEPECIDHLLCCFEELEYAINMLPPVEKAKQIIKFHVSVAHFDALIAHNNNPSG